MIISPPFLPGLNRPLVDEIPIDPMMDAVDQLELSHHGVYPIGVDRRWHGGVHLTPALQNEPVRAIADGEVVAYRVSQKAITDGRKNSDGSVALNSNTGFVLLRHTTETGKGRTITFYSLYMHLLDLDTIRQKFGPLPSALPDTGSSTVLPRWLANPTDGVQVTQGMKVYRKDILGYVGGRHGQRHLHFEIFMTDVDFQGWFEKPRHAVQLGNENPSTPQSKDYWGHTYFVISGGQVFLQVPQGINPAQQKYFPALQGGTLDVGSKLYVEAYFHKGQRYTRSWLKKNGAVTPLTSAPVRDAYIDFEYDLYARAMALYPQCPSDGYELLRFGRILHDQPTLPDAARATWVSVMIETGKAGYIDINQGGVQKLSDADFPFFMGWRKLDERTTPFDHDGLCDLEELRNVVQVVEDVETSAGKTQPVHEREARLADYVRTHAEVRQRLRGLIFHAPSEWDGSGNDARYRRLNDPDQFFGKRKEADPDAYSRFIRFQEQFQFLERTPLGREKKFWFFHPLAFIRHFRKCRWISVREVGQIIPARAWLKKSGPLYVADPTLLTKSMVHDRLSPHLDNLNNTIRKYVIDSSPERIAIFLAQTFIETDRWKTFREYGKGASHPNIPMAQYYSAFYGRGVMQLTWASTYEAYGRFKSLAENTGQYEGESRINQNSLHYWEDPTIRDAKFRIVGIKGTPKKWAPLFDPDKIASDSALASDSGGFFWVWKRHSKTRNINRVADSGFTGAAIDRINVLVNGGAFGYFERFAFSWYTRHIFTDWLPSGDVVTIDTPRRARVRVDLSKP